MPIGNVSKESPAPKRETFRPPWVKDKDTEAPPPWTQKKLKPVESTSKSVPDTVETPVVKPLKLGPSLLTIMSQLKSFDDLLSPTTPTRPQTDDGSHLLASPAFPKPATLKKQATIKDKGENGVSEPSEENLVKPSAAKLSEKASKAASGTVDKKPNFLKSTVRTIDKSNDKVKLEDNSTSEKAPERPILKSVRTIDDKSKDKSVTIVDRKQDKNDVAKNNTPISERALNGKVSTNSISKDGKTDPKVEEKPSIKSKIDDKTAAKSKVEEKVKPKSEDKIPVKPKSDAKTVVKPKAEEKVSEKSKTDVKADSKSSSEEKSKMDTKPPTSAEKPPTKLPPRKPPLQKAPSKDDVGLKKWRDPLHERVKENIDKTLANEIPKGHTLTKNESLRSLLKPAPPPMPPPLPPKMPPPPEFKKAPLDPTKLKKIEQLRSRPRRRPDWSDMMKEVEEGKKLKHVVCNDRSSPIIAKSTVVKNKDQFIFESEKPNSHNELLKEISKGIRLKKVKCNDRSKPNLEGLRKFRRQMTIEEQVQKSMSQANIAASPSGVSIAEAPAPEEEEIDEMDDIDKVRDDLQSTKQLLAIELRNKEAQERENKRLLTRIQNLEAELARERAIIKQEQHKTVISVTDAYDERLVNNLKMEVEKAKETADNLEKKYLEAAEERDDALTDLEDLKRKNAELEKKLEQAMSNKLEELYSSEEPLSFYQKRQLDFEKQCRLLNIDINSPEAQDLKRKSNDANNNNAAFTNNNYQEDEGIMPTSVGSRRSSHAIKQLSVTKDDSFEEEEESEEEEEESEEKKQKRMEKEIRNMRNKIRHLKEKQDNMKRERMGYKMALKNQQAALKDAKKKYKELKREVDKMAAMMKEVGSDEEEDEEEEEEDSEDTKKSETEEEESETETEQDTESETESESEPEDAPLPDKKDNLTKRLKRHETRVNALKKGNTLLMANVDRLKDDVLKQREESMTLQKELDSLIEDLE